MTAQTAASLSQKTATLRQRVLRAGGWTLAGYVLAQVIRFAGNLVMTRLLVPEMFGVMAIAQTIIVGLGLFSDLGLRPNIIQSRRGHEARFLNTVWVTQILLGVFMCAGAAMAGIALALAARLGGLPPGSAYADPVLPYVVAALGVSVLISNLQSTKPSEASRRLALGRLVWLQMVGQVIAILAMLVFAIFDRSVWVLVVGAIVGNVAWVILSHRLLPGTDNRLQWDRAAFREIVSFGKWIFVSSMVGFLAMAGDKIVLGALVSAGTLGVYSIAMLLLMAVEQIFQKITGEVAYPALGEIARERAWDLKDAVYKFYVPLGALCFAAAGFTAVAGGVVVRILYDARYQDAGWMLQVLSGTLVAVPFGILSHTFLALGISKWQSHLSVVRLLVFAVALPAGFHMFGLIGAICGVALSYLSAIPVTLYYARECKLVDLKKLLLPLLAAVPGVLAGAATVALIPN